MEGNGQAHAHGRLPSSAVVGNDGDRGPRGRFAAGNKAGSRFTKGNKAAAGHANVFQRQLGRIRLALATALTDEDVRAIVAALVRMIVQDGSLRAARFLFSFVVGPPMGHCVDPDSVDSDELRKLRLEAQADALDNHRLSPQIALAVEKAEQAAAAVGTLGEGLLDRDSDMARHLAAVLKEDGLHELLRAAKAYRDDLCERMGDHEPG